MRYDVFVSYSHTGDDLLSERVQDGLQRFAKPWWRRRALSVFRDRTALSANPGLWSSIAEAIDESRYFLMLASPDAAASAWVAREVAQWRAQYGSANLLVLLTDGEIVWDSDANDFDWHRTTALGAAAFAGCFLEEPRHVDMRWARSEVQLDLTDGRFRDQIAELAAPVHGMAKDELAGADVRQHRRTLRHAFAAGVALVVLTIAALAAAASAVSYATTAGAQRRSALMQRERATQNAELARAQEALAKKNGSRAKAESERAVSNEAQAKRNADEAEANAARARVNAMKADANAAEARANAEQASANAARARLLAENLSSANSQLSVGNALLRQTTGQLSDSNGKLADTNGQLADANGKLASTNAQLKDRNKQLRDANDRTTAAAKEAARQRDEAARQREKATRQRDDAESHALAASAGVAYDQGRFDLGLLLASEAIRINPVHPDAQARASLLSGLRLQPTLVGHLQGLTSAVTDVAFSPDGRMLAASALDGTVDVWDVQARARIAQQQALLPGCESGGVVVFSPNSKLVASTSACGGDIVVWDPRTGAIRRSLHPSAFEAVNSLAFDPTGTLLAAGYVQEPATIWDVDTAQVLRTLAMSPGANCSRPVFSPDDTVVACDGEALTLFGAPADAVTMQFWSVRTGRPLGPPSVAYLGLEHDLFSLTFSADSKILTTVATGGGVRPFIRWDVTTGHAVGAPFGPLLAPGDPVVGVSPDLRQIVSENAADQSLSLHDASTGQSSGPPLRIPLGGGTFIPTDVVGTFNPTGAVAFSPDGGTLSVGGADGPVRLWQSELPARLATTLPIAVAPGEFVGLSPNGRIAATSGSSTLVDVASGRPLTRQPQIGSLGLGFGLFQFSGDSRTLVWIGSDGNIRRWDITSGQLVGRPVPADCFLLLAVTFDGRTAAVNCGDSGDVKVIDLDSGRTISDLHTTEFVVLHSAFSRDGRLLALGGTNVQIWDVSSGSLAAIQPDQGQGARPASLAFSPDGHTLAAGGALGIGSPLVLWDVANGQRRLTTPQGSLAGSVEGALVVFSPDRKTVATGAADGAVRLWDVASAQPIGPPFTRLPVIHGQVQGNPVPVAALAFAADGQSLISATGGDIGGVIGPGEIVRWDLSVRSWQQQACTIANRNLTAAERTQYLGTFAADETTKTCPNLP